MTTLGVECVPTTHSCSSPLHQRRMVLRAFGCTPRRKFFDTLADNRLAKYTPFASKGATNGGAQARWRRDGKELFYMLDGRLMAVPIRIASTPQTIEAGSPAGRARKQSLGG